MGICLPGGCRSGHLIKLRQVKFRHSRHECQRHIAIRLAKAVETLLKAAGVRFFCLRQSFKPVGDFAEAFFASRLRHARIHIRVLVGFASNRSLLVGSCVADRQAGCGIANLL